VANDYASTTGPLPNPKTNAFLSWIPRRYQYIRDYVNTATTNTYYFSTSGSDANPGTELSPKQTVAEMNTLIVANSGDTTLYLKRGDEWNTNVSLALNRSNVRVFAYGSGNKPWLNRYAQKYTASGWTLAAGNRYTRAEVVDTSWVRYQGWDNSKSTSLVLSKQTSAANCEATSNSFFWGANVLHVNLGGTNPNTVNLEGNITSTTAGIVVTVDGCWIDNIRVDGFGQDTANPHSPQAYQIGCSQASDEICYVSNCEGYYGGTHIIAQFQGAGSGAITFFENCSAGFTLTGGSGETVYNTFSSTGLQETYFENCTLVAATLPTGTAAWVRRGISFYGHTAGAGAVASLIISRNCTIAESPYGTSRLSFFDDLPTVTTDADIRGFIIKERHTGAAFSSTPYKNQAWIACDYILTPAECGGQSMFAAGVATHIFDGWAWNCIIDIDFSGQSTTNTRSLYNANATLTNNNRMWHNAFTFRTAATVAWRTDLDSAGVDSSPSCQFFNNIYQSNTAAIVYVGLKNNTANLKNNAYFQIVGGADVAARAAYGNDAGKVALAALLTITPQDTKILDRLGYVGIGLEYDKNGNPRSITQSGTIGPYDLTQTGNSTFRERGGGRGRLLWGVR